MKKNMAKLLLFFLMSFCVLTNIFSMKELVGCKCSAKTLCEGSKFPWEQECRSDIGQSLLDELEVNPREMNNRILPSTESNRVLNKVCGFSLSAVSQIPLKVLRSQLSDEQKEEILLQRIDDLCCQLVEAGSTIRELVAPTDWKDKSVSDDSRYEIPSDIANAISKSRLNVVDFCEQDFKESLARLDIKSADVRSNVMEKFYQRMDTFRPFDIDLENQHPLAGLDNFEPVDQAPKEERDTPVGGNKSNGGFRPIIE